MSTGENESVPLAERATGTGYGGASVGSRVPFIKVLSPDLDVLIVPDPDGTFRLDADRAESLCDWDTGVGAHAIMRIVPLAGDAAAPASLGGAEWFVEARFANGSLDAMSNRFQQVVGSYLAEYKHCEPGMVAVATAAGVHRVQVPECGAPDAAA